MSTENLGELQKHPKFQDLVRRRSSFAWTLAAIMLAIYYGFIMVIAFVPEVLGTPLGGSTITLGIPVGLAVIVSAFLLTGIYVRRANTEFDAIVNELKKEVE